MPTSSFRRATSNVWRSTGALFSTFWSLSAVLTTCFFVNSPGAYAQSGFAATIGGTGSDEGESIAVDGFGNVYTTGTFEGTADFDPGANVLDIASAGGSDIFVSKLNASGDLVWAKVMGGTGIDQALGIAVDDSGNVYITGSFEDTADFDPGTDVLDVTSAGGSDIFVSKLDPSGNLLWVKAMGGTGIDLASSITVDASGNVHTTGSFEGTVDFDPGTEVFNITSAGADDIFVSKLDASGNLVWVKAMGGTGTDRASGIAVDASGNVHTAGSFENTADFDPGTGVFNLSNANGNVFVSKLDASGNFLWAKAMGGTGSDRASGIAVDTSGNVHIVGYFQDTADFDPGTGVFNLAAAGGRDIFVSKLDASGIFLWAAAMGGTDRDEGSGIAVDASGNLYTTGFFEGTADFDPGPDLLNLTSAGLIDIFVSKLNSSGELVWAKAMGGQGDDRALGIAADASEKVYTAGSFEGVADFDPGADLLILQSAGLLDIFVSRLGSAGTLPLLGDANLDGIVNSTDTLWMIQFEFGLRDGLTNETSDLNGDGFINSTDALWAIQIEVGQRPQP